MLEVGGSHAISILLLVGEVLHHEARAPCFMLLAMSVALLVNMWS